MIEIVRIEGSVNDSHEVIDYTNGHSGIFGVIRKVQVDDKGSKIYMLIGSGGVISDASDLRVIADKIDELNNAHNAK